MLFFLDLPAILARLLACLRADIGIPCARESGRDVGIPPMARKSDSLRYFLEKREEQYKFYSTVKVIPYTNIDLYFYEMGQEVDIII